MPILSIIVTAYFHFLLALTLPTQHFRIVTFLPVIIPLLLSLFETSLCISEKLFFKLLNLLPLGLCLLGGVFVGFMFGVVFVL